MLTPSNSVLFTPKKNIQYCFDSVQQYYKYNKQILTSQALIYQQYCDIQQRGEVDIGPTV